MSQIKEESTQPEKVNKSEENTKEDIQAKTEQMLDNADEFFKNGQQPI